MALSISPLSRLGVLCLSFIISSLVSAEFLAPKNCSISPFAIPFGNVSILDDPPLPGAHRGLNFELGSAMKRLSLNIATTMNTTFLSDGPKVCNSSHPEYRECVFWRGGLFSKDQSTSWEADKKTVPYNGSVQNPGYDPLHAKDYEGKGEDPLASFPRGWDTMRFDTLQGKSLQINGYPLTIIDNPVFPFGAGMLGLASDSRFLESVVAANLTPSHSWGLDYGTTNPDSTGELVIGGYNPSKAHMDRSKNFTIFADKSIPCPLQVKVKSVKYDGVDLTSETFTACIEPAVWSLVLPIEAQTKFNDTVLQTSSSTGEQPTWEYFFYNSSAIPSKETMTFEIEDGFPVTVPNNELFQQRRQLEGKGGWSYVRRSWLATLGNAGYLPSVEPIFQLGAPFLSQVYLGVDYEAGTFFLSPVNRDSSSSSELQVLGCDGFKQGKSGGGSNTGAIAGGVVGGVAGLALIAAAIIFLRRQKGKNPPVDSDAHKNGEYKAQYDAKFDENRTSIPPAYQTPQIGSDTISEAPLSPASPARHEMQGSPVVAAELPGEMMHSPHTQYTASPRM